MKFIEYKNKYYKLWKEIENLPRKDAILKLKELSELKKNFYKKKKN